jgi:Flp pilus assembly pilin Flp
MRTFLKNEDGLVTIEWVGIAAVMVLAAVAITGFVMKGADTTSQGIKTGVEKVGTAAAAAPVPGTFGQGATPP